MKEHGKPSASVSFQPTTLYCPAGSYSNPRKQRHFVPLFSRIAIESREQKIIRQERAWRRLCDSSEENVLSAKVALSEGGRKLHVSIGIPDEEFSNRADLDNKVSPLPAEIREFAVEPFSKEKIPWDALDVSPETARKLSGLIHCAWQEMMANLIEHDLFKYHEDAARREMVDLKDRLASLREQGTPLHCSITLEFISDEELSGESTVRMVVHNRQKFENFETLCKQILEGNSLSAYDVPGGMGLMITLATYPNARQEQVIREDGSQGFDLIFEASINEMVQASEERAV